jgi:hypothetical protein
MREGGQDRRITTQACLDSICHLLKFGWDGDVISEEGEASICKMDRLHLKRRFLPECTVDSSHKSREGVCRRGSLQWNQDLPV